MTIIRDEQIIASIYALRHWSKLTQSFVDTLAPAIRSGLLPLGIIWQRNYKDFSFLCKKYPEYFKMESNVLNCIKTEKETFDAFLATLPENEKTILATVLGELSKAN